MCKFFILLAILLVVFITWFDVKYESKPDVIARHASELAECRKPVMVAETPDGTQLWRYNRICDPVEQSDTIYFSKSGTTRNYVTCSGIKITHCYNHEQEVPAQ